MLNARSYEGASNRAYYAMFSAARAVLDVRTDLDVEDIRRHSAVLKLFSQHAVKTGLISAELNASINEAFEVRAIADYSTIRISAEQAEEIVALMEQFLRAVEPLVANGPRP